MASLADYERHAVELEKHTQREQPLQQILMVLRDRLGRNWVVAGLMGKAQPSGFSADPMELRDMEDLELGLIEFKVVD